jgi:hypothetical protein
MMRLRFGLPRDPTAVPEVLPLSRISLDLSQEGSNAFHLQRTTA